MVVNPDDVDLRGYGGALPGPKPWQGESARVQTVWYEDVQRVRKKGPTGKVRCALRRLGVRMGGAAPINKTGDISESLMGGGNDA
jgi:hypothetical protein